MSKPMNASFRIWQHTDCPYFTKDWPPDAQRTHTYTCLDVLGHDQ